MWMYLCKMFGLSLLYTECIEIMMAAGMGVRNKKSFFLVFFVNLLTNPVAVYAAWIARTYLAEGAGQTKEIIYLMIEILVVLTEGMIYYYNMKEKKHPFLFSLCANAVSYGVGRLLQIQEV